MILISFIKFGMVYIKCLQGKRIKKKIKRLPNKHIALYENDLFVKYTYNFNIINPVHPMANKISFCISYSYIRTDLQLKSIAIKLNIILY